MASIACALTGADGSALGSTRLSVAVLPTLWPLYDDVITVSADGFLHSQLSGAPAANATNALVAGSCSADGAAAAAAANYTACSVAAGSANPDVVLEAAQAAFQNVTLDAGVAAAAPFALTLSGESTIVLRARVRAFAAGTTVTLGGVPCTGLRVSADGQWLAMLTPSLSALQCANTAGDCGYAVLVVTNPSGGAGAAARRLTELTNASNTSYLGAAMSCPPWCPGGGASDIVPLATDNSGSFVPAIQVSRTRGTSSKCCCSEATLLLHPTCCAVCPPCRRRLERACP